MGEQSKVMSGIEATMNVVVGYSVAFISNIYVLPLFGFNVTYEKAAWIGVIYTIISWARSYLLRRAFNMLHHFDRWHSAC